MEYMYKMEILFSINGKDAVLVDVIWDDLRVFLALAREGTLTGAARRLRLGLATVSRRIERLEAQVDQPLFVRLQTGYRLTEDGAELVERAEAMEACANGLGVGGARTPDVSGRVCLATAENLANHLIMPALAEFRAQYPRLTLDVVTDISTVNLHRRDADLALRMVAPVRGHVMVQKLGLLGYGLYGAPRYIAQRTRAGDSSAYDHDDFITWSEAQAHLPAADWVERRLCGRAPALSTTSLSSQFAACRAGVGLAVLPHFLAQPDGLVCVDADLGVDQAIWLVTQKDLMQSRRVQAVAGFCRMLVATHRAQLAGR
ncbi:LysR family transcriptional regulator [Rhodobacteraceae bacterium]|nr:LysR family transcriptional regulator [Paracoccaceae bacterium]